MSKPHFLQKLLLLLLLSRNLPRPRHLCVLLSPHSAAQATASALRLQGQIPIGALQQAERAARKHHLWGSPTHSLHCRPELCETYRRHVSHSQTFPPCFQEGDTTEGGMDNNMLIKEHGGRDGGQERKHGSFLREAKAGGQPQHPDLERTTAVLEQL